MTLLWVALAFLGGASIRPVLSSVARRREPALSRVFAGRVFPHPDDELWTIRGDLDAYWNGTLIHVDKRDTVTSLIVNDVTVFRDNRRADRYLAEIVRCWHDRRIAKALEALP